MADSSNPKELQEKLQEMLANEAFAKELFAKETVEDVQVALEEKGIDFAAGTPNEKWASAITEFRLPDDQRKRLGFAA